MLRRANPDLRPGLTPDDVAELIVALLDSPLAAVSGANIPLFSNGLALERLALERLAGVRPWLSDHRSVRSSASTAGAGRACPATSRAAAAISPSWSSSGSPPRSRPTAARTTPSTR